MLMPVGVSILFCTAGWFYQGVLAVGPVCAVCIDGSGCRYTPPHQVTQPPFDFLSVMLLSCQPVSGCLQCVLHQTIVGSQLSTSQPGDHQSNDMQTAKQLRISIFTSI